MTYTVATMGVSDETYEFFWLALTEAGYDHALTNEGIDMTHIMLVRAGVDLQDRAKVPTNYDRMLSALP